MSGNLTSPESYLLLAKTNVRYKPKLLLYGTFMVKDLTLHKRKIFIADFRYMIFQINWLYFVPTPDTFGRKGYLTTISNKST